MQVSLRRIRAEHVETEAFLDGREEGTIGDVEVGEAKLVGGERVEMRAGAFH